MIFIINTLFFQKVYTIIDGLLTDPKHGSIVQGTTVSESAIKPATGKHYYYIDKPNTKMPFYYIIFNKVRKW